MGNEAEPCTECGKGCDNLTIVDDETRVCETCLVNEFTFCDRCEQYWRNGVIDVEEIDGENVCEYCQEDDSDDEE